MALNFPINPADGDTYEGYVYNATAGVWNSDPHQIASRFVTSATAPSSASEGDGWFDTNTAKSYVYYDGVWVQLGAFGTVDLNQIADVNVDSPANGESLVYDGTEWVNENVTVEPTEIYDVDSDSTGFFSLPVGTEAQRPTNPQNGNIRFNSDAREPEWYSSLDDEWFTFRTGPANEFSLTYLAIAGGGGGADDWGGGGGAGGLLTSTFTATTESYAVTIGGGGGGATSPSQRGVSGSDTVFNTVTCVGGGGGGGDNASGGDNGLPGGSGGGGAIDGSGGSGTAGQGNGGAAGNRNNNLQGGGGGGAGASGSGQSGGAGLQSSISGTATFYAGGGSAPRNSSSIVAGGVGGGGDGGDIGGSAGETNKGGGGGGYNGGGFAGGSGVVILKYPVSYNVSPSAGLASTSIIDGTYRVTTITAGTGFVTFQRVA